MPIDISVDRPGNCGNFVRSWVAGGSEDSYTLRRQFMAFLRMACMTLGMGRKRLGVGLLGFGAMGYKSIGFSGMATAGLDIIVSFVWLLPSAFLSLAIVSPVQAGTCVQMEAQGTSSVMGAGASSPATCGSFSIAIGGGSGAQADNFGVAVGDAANSTGLNSVAVGRQTIATGENSTVIGRAATANALNSTAIGNFAQATAAQATSLGAGANASGKASLALGSADPNPEFVGGTAAAAPFASGARAIAIGSGTNSTGLFAIAIGSTASAVSQDGIALGRNAMASNAFTTAIGHNAKATGIQSQAYGLASVASGPDSIALGDFAEATAAGASALGPASKASADRAVAVGILSSATGLNSTSLGSGAKATAAGALAIGNRVIAAGENSQAMGTAASAGGNSSTAIGNASNASGLQSIAIGAASSAQAQDSVAIGSTAKALGINSLAFGVNTSAQADGAIAIGQSSVAKGGQAVAIGVGQSATGDGAVAIGDPNTVNGTGAVAVGANNLAAGNTAGTVAANGVVAIGSGNIATGDGSVALGRNSVAGGSDGANSAIAIGENAQSQWGVAIGENATTNAGQYGVSIGWQTSTGLRGVAIGFGSDATGDGAVAIGGVGTSATANGGVALGEGSTAGRAGMNGATELFSGTVVTSTRGTLSVGSNGNERQITNVAGGTQATDAVNVRQLQTVADEVAEIDDRAVKYDGAVGDPKDTITLKGMTGTRITNLTAGAVNATSTDAITGSQLYKASNSIATHLGGGAMVHPDGTVNSPVYTMQGGTYTTVYDTFAAVDANLTNINNGGGIKYFHANSVGPDSRAIGQESVAVGRQATANADNSVAIGYGATTVTGAEGAVAIGQGASANNANDVALGADSVTQGKIGTPGATINGKYYAFAGTTPVGTVSIGGAGAKRTITNVAAGQISANSTDAINGSQLWATNTAIDNLDDLVDGAVLYDKNPNGSRVNSVTLIGGDPSAPVLLSNVADGVANNDAVNVGQLKKGLSKTLVDANTYTDNRVFYAIDTAKTYTDQVAVTTLNQANEYTDYRFGQLNQEIGKVRSEARQAAAIGLAASSLRYDDRPGKLSAAIGGGVWQGQGALALGAGYTSENGRVRANLSATTSGGHWGVGAGLSVTLN